MWEAISLAQDSDESLHIAKETVNEQSERKHQAFAQILPQISSFYSTKLKNESSTSVSAAFGAVDSELDNGVDQFYGVSLKQTIWNAKTFGYYTRSNKELKLAILEQEKAIQSSIINVTEAYLNVLSQISRLKLAKAEVEAVKLHKKHVDVRYSINESTTLDIAETQANIDLAKLSVIEADNRLSITRQILARYINKHDFEVVPVNIELEFINSIDLGNVQSWLDAAYESNIDLRVILIRKKIAELDIKQAIKEFSPNVDFQASWTNSETESNSSFGMSMNNAQATNFEVSVSLPLYSGGSQVSRLRQSRSALRKIELQLSQQRKLVHQNINYSYQNLLHLHKKVFALQSLVESNKKKLEATRVGFEQDTRTSTDLLDAQQLLFKSEVDAINTIHDYILTTLKLRQTAGVLSLLDTKTINSQFFSL